MPKLNLILGAARTGKSTVLYDRLCEHMERGEHAVLLVPEQSTFAAEQELASRLGGLLGIEVYSMERFTERILEQYGRSLPFLNEQGRAMVVRRAALRRQKELSLFRNVSRSNGFATVMDQWIGRFKQSRIPPESLDRVIDALPEGELLQRKLRDISILYRDSEAFLNNRYLTSHDQLNAVLSLLPDTWVRSCHFYVDDFDRIQEQAFYLLTELVRLSPSVTMTLRIDPDDGDNASLFLPDIRIEQRLRSYCAERNIPLTARVTNRPSEASPAIRHLCGTLFSRTQTPYPAKTDAVTLVSCADRRTEAENVADTILSLVQSNGLRFSDFAVMVSDVKTYTPLVRRAFFKRNIPLFSDATRPMQGHTATTFVLAAVRAASNHFPIGELLTLLKSGYTGVPVLLSERLENYLLRYGIYGSDLIHPLHIGETDDELEQARQTLMEPLIALKDALKNPLVSDKVRGIYTYLDTLSFGAKLEQQARALQAEGQNDEALVYQQIWNTLSSLFSELYTIMGDTPVGLSEFAVLLDEGMAGFTIGTLPGRKDCVVLGDLVRSRIRPVHTLFLLGCNEGLFPPAHNDDAFLNDRELERLQSFGLSVWNNTDLALKTDRLSLYSLFSKANRRIVFSYACSDKGTDLVPSALLESIRTLFPNAPALTVLETATELPYHEALGFTDFSARYRLYQTEGILDPLLPTLYEYYKTHPVYRDVVSEMERGNGGTVSPEPFGKDLAAKLYGTSPSMSASRLELFSRCPFAQYLRYGLRAEERKVAEERAADSGTFLHDVLDGFVKTVSERNLDWMTMTESDADAILNAILPPLLASHNDGILLRNPMLKESLFLRIRTARSCVLSVMEQLQSGSFTVLETEMSFGMNDGYLPVRLPLSDGRTVSLYGKIDRVDGTKNGSMLRIIDYKLGSARTFDPTKFYSGESLQLPIYLSAARQLGGNGVGMYYMPLTLPTSSDEQPPTHKLNGITVGSDEVLNATDGEETQTFPFVSNLKRTKDGRISGSVCSEERMNAIVDEALTLAARNAERILSGEAGLLPTERACDWCPYSSVCRFDKQLGCKNRFTKKHSMEELLSGKEETDGLDR